jgi:hypothetical protein
LPASGCPLQHLQIAVAVAECGNRAAADVPEQSASLLLLARSQRF